MSSTLGIRTQPSVGRKERQSVLGVFGCCRMIHQCEADRENADLSPAYQTRRLARKRKKWASADTAQGRGSSQPPSCSQLTRARTEIQAH